MSLDVLLNTIISGVLLGGFYAAVSIGLAITFGLLNIPQVAHPTFIVLAGYGTVVLNQFGIDPIVSGLLLTPVFFGLGWLFYLVYNVTFERRGADVELRSLAFFFGVALIIERLISIKFGSDFQSVDAPYIGKSLHFFGLRFPYRMLIASTGAVIVSLMLTLFLARSFVGRAIQAVAQDSVALQIVGADPVHIKTVAFAVSTATVAISGSLLTIVGPVTPGLGRLYLGKVFAIVVLAGLGSIRGVFVAAIFLGLVENFVLSSFGISWTPAVAFGMLLLILAIAPNGIFGK